MIEASPAGSADDIRNVSSAPSFASTLPSGPATAHTGSAPTLLRAVRRFSCPRRIGRHEGEVERYVLGEGSERFGGPRGLPPEQRVERGLREPRDPYGSHTASPARGPP